MFIDKYLNLIKVRGLRRILRGHRILKQSDRLWKINAVNEELTFTEFRKSSKYSKIIFGSAVTDAELVVRQYMLMRLAGIKLGKSILYAYGNSNAPKVVFPLPPEWRQVLTIHGFKVASFRCSVWWYLYVMYLLLYGIHTIGKFILFGIKEIFKPVPLREGEFVFFNGLSSNNLPSKMSNGVSENNIISWYLQWSGRIKVVEALYHTVTGESALKVDGVPLVGLRTAVTPPNKSHLLFKYVCWAFVACLISVFDLLRGHWWNALMLSEASMASLVRMNKSNILARDYLFHNSSWIYRPLWTYEVEAKGSRILFYFYSTNCQPFKRIGVDPERAYFAGYQAMSWPHYLVWDQFQADFVRSVSLGSPLIDIVGPIWFSSSALPLPSLPEKTVAVFDVQPVRDLFYNTLAIDFDYYTPKISVKFIQDIQNVFENAGYVIVLKRKRDLGKLIHPEYRRLIASFQNNSECIQVDPCIDALSVIEKCALIISMPFTSTALLGRNLGKPSIYYDPTGLLQKDDPAAHGIQIIQGRTELATWLKGIL